MWRDYIKSTNIFGLFTLRVNSACWCGPSEMLFVSLLWRALSKFSVIPSGASANASAHVFGVLGLSMDFHRWWIGYSALLARVVRIPLNELHFSHMTICCAGWKA